MSKVKMTGYEAAAEAALRAGCRFFAGYPAAPQNDLLCYMAQNMQDRGGCFLQSESEVGSVHMVLGASSGGTRAMTASSGNGMALMAEGISVACGMELPMVILSASGGGLGDYENLPAQQDYFQATRAVGNGGIRPFVFAPSTVQEAADLTYEAFGYADEVLYPVILLMDAGVGHQEDEVELPRELSPDEVEAVRASKSKWATVGKKPGEERHASNLTLREPVYKKREGIINDWKANRQMAEEYLTEDAEIIITAYGIESEQAKAAADILRDRGIAAGVIRPVTLFPFPAKSFDKLGEGRVRAILDVELSVPSQMEEDVHLAVSGRIPVESLTDTCGAVITAEQIAEKAEALLK